MPWPHCPNLGRRPNLLIAVDTGSVDDSLLLLKSSGLFDRVLTLPPDTTFGAAVNAAVEIIPINLSDSAPPDWLWLLHDDCAPEANALSELLSASGRHEDARVLGPKLRGWHDRELLVECGVTVTNSGRRFTGLEIGDRDQGQRDHLREVLAVSSAGMLVRADVWRNLGGFDPDVEMFGDDIEFCMRANRAGAAVYVVPAAVIHHREAGLHGVRAGGPQGAEVGLRRRAAGLYTTLVHGPAWLLPLTSLLLFVRTLVSAAILLVGGGPPRAWAEVRTFMGVHLHPMRVVKARHRVRAVAQVPRRDVAALRPGLMEQVALGGERLLMSGHAVIAPRTGSGAPWAGMGVSTALTLAAVFAVVAAAATRMIWTATGPLAGGALLPVPDGGTLWQDFLTSWHDVGLGSAEPSAAYPLLLAAGSAIPFVSAADLVQVLLLFTVPLAVVSAFLALRGYDHKAARIGLAVAYGLAPSVVMPSLDGRLGTATVAILLPWLARLLMRLLGGAELLPVLGRARVRTAAAAALLLAVCASVAPLVWVAVSVATVLAAALRARERAIWWGVALVVVGPILLLAPWSFALFADPSRVMFEAGISSPQLVAPAPPGWRLLLLDPGTLPVLRLPAAGGLLILAAAGLVSQRSRGLAVWGWALAVVGLIGAVVQSSQEFVPIGATTAQYGYVGPMLCVMAVGMVLAAASMARAARPSEAIARQGLTYAIMVVLLAGPAVLAVQWVAGLPAQLGRTDVGPVPAFVTEQALSTDRVRTLLLGQGESGSVAYALVNGDGGRLGDADVAPPAQTWDQITAAVGGLAAGIGPGPVQVLADNAVRYIVADTTAQSLAQALDSNPALVRMSTVDGRGLWQITGDTARARVAFPDGVQPVAVDVEGLSSGVLVDARVPAGPQANLVVAQVNDGQWQALVDGAPVQAQGEGQVVVPLPANGEATVRLVHSDGGRGWLLLLPLLALTALLLMLIPRRHIGTPLPDPDAAPTDRAPAQDVDVTDGARTQVLP